MIFQLPHSVYKQYDNYSGNGQSGLLQEVRTSLQRTYPTTIIGADGQVIKIAFDDNLTFEIVPAFENNDKSYTYPDTNNGGRWHTTNPRPEIKAVRDRNTACNRNLVRLCRMMRSWKSQWDVPIGGLLIDTLAYQFIDNWDHNTDSFYWYDYMCRDFFRFLSEQDKDQKYWRAPGSGQYVYRRGPFEWKALRCYNISLKAITHETSHPKQEWSAKQEWREIFGTKFPS